MGFTYSMKGFTVYEQGMEGYDEQEDRYYYICAQCSYECYSKSQASVDERADKHEDEHNSERPTNGTIAT